MEQADRLSALPEPLVHHIMSFLLPKDAARISGLSKKFKFLFYSFPIISFSETLNVDSRNAQLDGKWRVEEFLNFVREYMSRRPTNIGLEKLEFCVTICDYFAGPDSRIDGMIDYAIDNNVKELDLDLICDRYDLVIENYRLPEKVLFAKSLVTLKLSGFKVSCQNLLLNYPLLQELVVENLKGVEELKITGDRLKTMAIGACKDLRQLNVETPNLQFFTYNGVALGDNWLQFCRINIANCKSLIYLFFIDAWITEELLQCIVSKYALLNCLTFWGCLLLKNLHVSSNNLENMEIEDCFGLENVQVLAPNLKNFSLKNAQSMPCAIDISYCKLLKELTLENVQITDQWLQQVMSQLCFLEDVKLNCCDNLQRVRFSHACLVSLQLKDCFSLEEVVIDVEKPMSFVYKTGDEFELPSVVSINTPLLHPGLFLEVDVDADGLPLDWFLRLRNLLTFFGHCENLTVICKSEQLLMFPEQLREILLPAMNDVKHLHVEINSPLQNLHHLVQSLLWLARLPDSICFVLGSEEKLLEFEYAMPGYGTQDLLSSISNPVKCWKNYLIAVTMENFEEAERMILVNFLTSEASMLENIYYKKRNIVPR